VPRRVRRQHARGARRRAGKDAGATERGVDCGTLLVVLGVVGVWSKPAPLKSTRVRHPNAGHFFLRLGVGFSFVGLRFGRRGGVQR
jgi:hypothetical protein